MKRIITNVMLLAVAAIALFSCQKQEGFTPESEEVSVLTFASEKPVFADETKTEWTGETIHWSEGDKISVAYTVNGVWQNATGNASNNAKLYKSDALEEASAVAQFNVSTSFTGAVEGRHVFYGVYPAPTSTDIPNAPIATLEVPSIQTPKTNSFDAASDLMIGVSVGELTARPAKGETISMKWTRLVAHANITLKALNGVTDGEKVLSLKLTAQDGANLVGQQKVNILNNEVVNDNTASNVLEINGGNLSIDSNGNVEFWVCILPETLTNLTVVVDTDKATYTREITGISKTFKKNARNILAINMSEATRDEKASTGLYYEKVTAEPEDWTGEYLIVFGSNAHATIDNKDLKSTVAVAINNDKIEATVDNAKAAVKVTKAEDKYNMSFVDGTYFGVQHNGCKLMTSAFDLDFDYTDAGVKIFGEATNSGATNTYILYYNSNNGSYYRCYTDKTGSSGYTLPILYRLSEGGDTPEPEARTLVSIAVADDAKTEYYVGEELVKPAVTATYDNGSTANVTASATFSGYDKTATGTQTVTVSYTENEVTATDSYTVTVSEKEETGEPEEITVAEFLELKDQNTEYTLTGKITRVANTSYGNFDITDATGTVYVYGLLTPDGAAQKQWAAAGLKQGDIITVKGVYSVYNDSPQIKNAVYVSHNAISVDKTSYTFAAEGGSFDVTATLVNATDAISVSVDNSQFTVALKSGTTYTVTAPANQTTENIYANLTFTAGELSAVVTITQEAPAVEGEIPGGRDDFNTVAANSSYTTRTTTSGWKGVNCAVMQGGTSDSNPTFKFIGSTNATRAFTINGKTSAKGTITSPTLTTGCGKLSLKYGIAFSESNGVDFTVTIKQNGTAVKTYKVDVNSLTQKKAYTWEQEVNVSGSFVIEITNNCPSNSSSNKDRVSIWDVEWTGCN